MDGFNNGGMNLNKKPAGNMQEQMNNQNQMGNNVSNQYYHGEAPVDNGGFNNQYQQNSFNGNMNVQQGPQGFNNGQNGNGGYTGGDNMDFTPYVNDSNYQNQSYTKSYQKAVKNRNYKNELNTSGAYNFNLMVYVLLATALLMAGQITALIILFAVTFIMEKNNKLNQVVITMLMSLLAFNVAYDIVLLLLQPLSSLFSSICNKADYGSFFYTISYGIVSIISTFRGILNWVYNIGLIGLGAFIFIKVDRGLFRVPKIISKYLN